MNEEALTKEELKRYRGHISLCEIDIPGQQALKRARVLVIGAGGLGAPVSVYLAAAGVGEITVIDPDTVSPGNLQRQILYTDSDIGKPKALCARDRLNAINPHITVNAITDRFTADNASELLPRYDAVADCTDSFETRLLISDLCKDFRKVCVTGSVARFSGQLFTQLPDTATYRDFFGDKGPEEAVACEIDGILNTVVGVIGSLQATEIIKALVGTGDLLTDRLLVFDAITMTFTEFRI